MPGRGSGVVVLPSSSPRSRQSCRCCAESPRNPAVQILQTTSKYAGAFFRISLACLSSRFSCSSARSVVSPRSPSGHLACITRGAPTPVLQAERRTARLRGNCPAGGTVAAVIGTMVVERVNVARAEPCRAARAVLLVCHEAHLSRVLLSGKPGAVQNQGNPEALISFAAHERIQARLKSPANVPAHMDIDEDFSAAWLRPVR